MSRRALTALLLLLMAATLWARSTTFRSVFPDSGETELVPTDSHFYVRFALLQLHALPSVTTFDPYINHPEGAQLYVPLPHALLVAAFISAFGEPRAELAAAWVGPVVGTLEWLLLTLLALRVLGRIRGLVLGALWALAPAIVEVAALGNADHHVHEPMFAGAVLLATLAMVNQPDRRGPAVFAGLLLGLARWLTPTGFLFLPVAGLALLVLALVQWRMGGVDQYGAAWSDEPGLKEPGLGEPGSREAGSREPGSREPGSREPGSREPRLSGPGDCDWRRLAVSSCWAGGTAAAILLLGALLFGRPAVMDYEQFSAFHPLLAVCAFSGAAAIALLTGRRWGMAGVLLLIAAGSAVPLLAQVLRAGGHLGRADPLLALVYESEPLWSDPSWALELLGPFLLALVPACVGLFLQMRDDAPTARREATVVLAFTLPLAAAGLLQARFSPLLATMAAAGCVVGLPRLLPRAGPARAGAIGLAAVLALPLLLALAPRPFRPAPRDLLLSRPTLHWIRDHLPPASSDPFSSSERPAYGVVTTHLLGHVVPLWAQRPTVATLLSQDPSFIAANRRAARVLAAEDDETAYAAAVATGARYVVATPSDLILGFGAPSERSQLLHLLNHAGMEHPARGASAHFRLVHDSPEQRLRPEGGSAARVFEVVPGALLSGSGEAGAEVSASLTVQTDQGQGLQYVRRTRAGPEGSFSLRVAYPGEYRLTVGGITRPVQVSEEQVLGGAGH